MIDPRLYSMSRPIINLPELPVVRPPVMLAANGPVQVPMPPPLTGLEGNVTQQFPDYPQEVPPDMPMPMAGMDLPEESMSGYRDFGGAPDAMPSASPAMLNGAPADPGILGRLFSGRGLAAVGMALQGMGGGQVNNPLAIMAWREQQRRDQEAGLQQAFALMGEAEQAPTATDAIRIYDAGLRDRRLSGSPEAARMAMQGRAKMAERAFQEGISGRVATILGADPEGYKEDLREQMLRANIPEASLEPALKGRRDRYAEATTADGQPVSIDRKTGLVKKHGEGSDWDKTITLGGIAYQYDRATQSLKRLGGVVTPEPGKTTSEIGPDGTARPLISAPAAPSDMTLKGYELWLGEVPRNPTPEQTRYAAGVGKLATVLGEDAILKAKSAGVLDRLLGIVGDTTPGTPAGDVSADLSNKAAGVVDTAQRDEKVLVARKQGEAAAQIREDTMKRAPAVAVEGLRSPETEIYDLTTGKKVDKLRPGIMADAEKNPGRYRIVQGDDTKSLRAVAGIEKFVPMFEEVSKRLTDQPGANVVQQIEFALKDRFGVADMNTVVSTMQGSQLVLAKAFQGTGSQLSDADRKTVEGLVPKSGDTGQQVMQKVNFLKTYTRLIRAAVLDDDAAADNALVDFVKNLPRTGGGKGGQIVPGQGIQVVP